MTRKEKGVINQSVEKAVAEILAQGNPAELFGNGGLFQELKKQLVCKILEHEMNAHIGYEKHSKDEKELNNRRNGRFCRICKSGLSNEVCKFILGYIITI